MSDLNQWSTFSYFLLYQLIVIWRFILLRGVLWDRWILNLSLIKLCDLEVMYGVNIVLSPFLFDSQSNFVKGNSNPALHPRLWISHLSLLQFSNSQWSLENTKHRTQIFSNAMSRYTRYWKPLSVDFDHNTALNNNKHPHPIMQPLQSQLLYKNCRFKIHTIILKTTHRNSCLQLFMNNRELTEIHPPHPAQKILSKNSTAKTS